MVTLEDPDSVLAYLAEPLQAAYECLDDGVSFADGILDGLAHDPHFWANAVRYHARHRLAEMNPRGWQLGRELKNCGIEIRKDPLVFRVLKAQDGGPPHPGLSVSRRRFFSQRTEQMVIPLEVGGVRIPAVTNLILDWTIGERRSLNLALCKPLGLWRYQGTPKLEWRRHVAFPSGGDRPRFVAPEEEFEIEPRYDLEELDDGLGDIGVPG